MGDWNISRGNHAISNEIEKKALSSNYWLKVKLYMKKGYSEKEAKKLAYKKKGGNPYGNRYSSKK